MRESKVFGKWVEFLRNKWYNKSSNRVTVTCNQRNSEDKGVDDVYSVFDIANWFLSIESMEHKKLQKLCYYAQSWSYVFNNQPLIQGDFQAWVHGPVHSSLWFRLKDYGFALVNKNELLKSANMLLLDADVSLLNDVWATYGEFSGHDLEKLTHSEAPWQNARRGLGEFEPSQNVISIQDITNYYRSLLSSGEGVGE